MERSSNLIGILSYGLNTVAGPGIGVQLPDQINTRQLGSLPLSLPVKLVKLVVVRVDQLPSLRWRCTLYVVAPTTPFQVKDTVPPPVGLVSEWLVITGAVQAVGTGEGEGTGVGVGVGVGNELPLATLL